MRQVHFVPSGTNIEKVKEIHLMHKNAFTQKSKMEMKSQINLEGNAALSWWLKWFRNNNQNNLPSYRTKNIDLGYKQILSLT